MAKLIKKFLFFPYILLENGDTVVPIDGKYYEGRQYYKGKLGSPHKRIAPPQRFHNRVEGGWYNGRQFHNGKLGPLPKPNPYA